MNLRYTLDGSQELEMHLSHVCDLVREGVLAVLPAGKVEGLALAGGYGRGEGGVLRSASGDAPYNDLEFFVFMRGSRILNERRHKAALHELGERLSPEAGIEVEFKIISHQELRCAPVSMFYYDLVMGHRWLIGNDALLAGAEHHQDAAQIPAHEVTRLLFNRCSGLLFAKERLKREVFTAEDADFVARNIAKARLALGDALLAAQGRYHWSCRERHQRMATLDSEIRAHHEVGVEFKLHPSRSTESREELTALHATVASAARAVFLQLEERRLGCRYDSAASYAACPKNKCPEQPRWKNFLHNLRCPQTPPGVSHRLERHPREALLRSLALLLWDCHPITPARVRAYEALWQRFN